MVRSKDLEDILEIFMHNVDRKCDSRYCIDKVNLIEVKPVCRGKYKDQICKTDESATVHESDIVVDEKVLQAFTPADVQGNKLDCSTQPVKSDRGVTSSQAAKAHRTIVDKIPLTIEITNYAVGAKFAAVPLIDQNLRDERYTYDDVRANVPTTFQVMLL